MSTTTASGDERAAGDQREAWWLMNLTSAVRGLTAGLATPVQRRCEALHRPTVGAPLSVDGDDDRAQQVQEAAGEGRARRRPALGLARDLLL